MAVDRLPEMLGAWHTIGRTCRRLEVSEQFFHRWPKQDGGMSVNEMRLL